MILVEQRITTQHDIAQPKNAVTYHVTLRINRYMKAKQKQSRLVLTTYKNQHDLINRNFSDTDSNTFI